MTKTGEYSWEGSHVLRRENPKTHYTVRLHFTEGNTDQGIVEEILDILMETYMRNMMAKGGEGLGSGEK